MKPESDRADKARCKFIFLCVPSLSISNKGLRRRCKEKTAKPPRRAASRMRFQYFVINLKPLKKPAPFCHRLLNGDAFTCQSGEAQNMFRIKSIKASFIALSSIKDVRSFEWLYQKSLEAFPSTLSLWASRASGSEGSLDVTFSTINI